MGVGEGAPHLRCLTHSRLVPAGATCCRAPDAVRHTHLANCRLVRLVRAFLALQNLHGGLGRVPHTDITHSQLVRLDHQPPVGVFLALQNLRGADFIIEAVAEDEAVKKEVFRNLDQVG